MRGNITRRGKASWRLKFDVGNDAAGNRKTRYVTVKGRRQDAQRELTRLLAAADAGTLPEPSKVTIAVYLRAWLDGTHGLSPKTAERYRELVKQQIIPHLGAVSLQRLKPSQVQEWHGILLKSGGKGGRALAARTVGHAHRVLHRALQRAVENETLARNVASVIHPPKVEEDEIEILDPEQIVTVMRKLDGHPLFVISALALATGMRRGELLALQLGDLDLDGASVRVERSLEQTAAGLRFKGPKTKYGRRTISLPPSAVAILRTHRRQQLETRIALGLGKPGPETLLFSNPDGSPISPNYLTRRWQDTCVALDLPRVTFHALRHTHASALIAAGMDVVRISRRLGHGSPSITLNIYAHLFIKVDTASASAIELALVPRGGTASER
jgi:integrase